MRRRDKERWRREIWEEREERQEERKTETTEYRLQFKKERLTYNYINNKCIVRKKKKEIDVKGYEGSKTERKGRERERN